MVGCEARVARSTFQVQCNGSGDVAAETTKWLAAPFHQWYTAVNSLLPSSDDFGGIELVALIVARGVAGAVCAWNVDHVSSNFVRAASIDCSPEGPVEHPAAPQIASVANSTFRRRCRTTPVPRSTCRATQCRWRSASS